MLTSKSPAKPAFSVLAYFMQRGRAAMVDELKLAAAYNKHPVIIEIVRRNVIMSEKNLTKICIPGTLSIEGTVTVMSIPQTWVYETTHAAAKKQTMNQWLNTMGLDSWRLTGIAGRETGATGFFIFKKTFV